MYFWHFHVNRERVQRFIGRKKEEEMAEIVINKRKTTKEISREKQEKKGMWRILKP